MERRAMDGRDKQEPETNILDAAARTAKAMTKAELQAEVDHLREKCNIQALVLKHVFPEKSPTATYFIAGEGGEKDRNGMPERIHVCPDYGCDWTAIYERREECAG